MDRRTFLASAAGGALALPLAAHAQLPGKVWRIGFFYFGTRQSALDTGRYDAFVQGMRDLGYVEGKNVAIEARFADGKIDQLPALAAELVRAKLDVIVATGSPVYSALRFATTSIPIVVTVTTDPVIEGLAASLVRPGGNFTGLTDTAADLGLQQIAQAALQHRLASIYLIRQYPMAGGLLSYGPDIVDNFRRATTYVDRILKGTKPTELPFEQPARYVLAVNTKTAKTLGLTIPQSVLVRADEVIQ